MKNIKLISKVMIILTCIVILNNLCVYGVSVKFSNESSNFGTAIFMELFCSIHMSVFVLFPLAAMINKKKKTITFCILFAIRFVILLIGDCINPMAMAMIDFFSIFIGAFLVIPICLGLKRELKSDKTKFGDIEEIELPDLSYAGIDKVYNLKEELINKYMDIKYSYSTFNYKDLKKLCTNGKYLFFESAMKSLEEKRYTNIFKDFDIDIKNSKIYSFSNINDELQISIAFKVEVYDYIIDELGNIQKGSDKKKNKYIYKATFSKNISKSQNNKFCYNCGAPISDNLSKNCEYCGCMFDDINRDWILEKNSENFQK